MIYVKKSEFDALYDAGFVKNGPTAAEVSAEMLPGAQGGSGTYALGRDFLTVPDGLYASSRICPLILSDSGEAGMTGLYFESRRQAERAARALTDAINENYSYTGCHLDAGRALDCVLNGYSPEMIGLVLAETVNENDGRYSPAAKEFARGMLKDVPGSVERRGLRATAHPGLCDLVIREYTRRFPQIRLKDCLPQKTEGREKHEHEER